eukprot:gene20451-22467_t
MASAKWLDFFKHAGIPSEPASEYAVVFTDNRMRMDMLNELTKDILGDLGIKVMGDVIAILRHSKKVYAEISRSTAEDYDVNKTKTLEDRARALEATTNSDPPTKSLSSTIPQIDLESKREVPGVKQSEEKAVANFHQPTIASSAKNSSKSLSDRFGEFNPTPAKKQKSITDETMTISVSTGRSKQQEIETVNKTTTHKGTKQMVSPTKKTVFDRLDLLSEAEINSVGEVVPEKKFAAPKIAKQTTKSTAVLTKDSKSSVFDRLGKSSGSSPTAQSSASSSERLKKPPATTIVRKPTTFHPTITRTFGDSLSLGLSNSDSVLRPVKSVKPTPRKPLAMDIQSSGTIAKTVKQTVSSTAFRSEKLGKTKQQRKSKMYLSENYLHFVKDLNKNSTDDYDVISVEDLALIPRKTSTSDCSSNGILSQDSGHDSYFDDGTGYSGDDEESLQCDICFVPTKTTTVDKNNQANGFDEKPERKSRRRRRRRRRKHFKKEYKKIENELKPLIRMRELPKNDNFEFEGEKKVEYKWTLQCYIDSLLVPRLRSVVIDRGRPEDLGEDNLMVFDESSTYCQVQTWRQNVFEGLQERNSREVGGFNLLPTSISCETCTEQRQKEVKTAVDGGRELKVSECMGTQSSVSQPCNKPERGMGESESSWRMSILNDLKMNNCMSIVHMKTWKRLKRMTTDRKTSKRHKSHHHHQSTLDIVEEEGWEIYDIYSDGEIGQFCAE